MHTHTIKVQHSIALDRLHSYLNGLLLQCQSVDYTNMPGFLRQSANAVFLIFPPWLSEIVRPVRARAGRWHMNKASHWGIGEDATS